MAAAEELEGAGRGGHRYPGAENLRPMLDGGMIWQEKRRRMEVKILMNVPPPSVPQHSCANAYIMSLWPRCSGLGAPLAL